MPKSNANSGSATLLDDPPGEFYRPPAGRAPDPRPSRTASDPEADAGEPFLRARRRVPVRRGLFPLWTRTRWGKAVFALLVLVVLGLAAALLLATRSFVDHDPRFRIDTAASIQTVGNSQLSRGDLLSVFGSDLGRNLFFVPLAQRRAELEQIPWVETATVMRVLPNQLRVAVKERTPIAFVQIHGRIELADIDGVILDMTPQDMAARHYAFPVVDGINPGDPLSMRSARMHLYQHFLADLDSTGEHISAQLSEVDLSDPEDVRATVPSGGSDLLLYFGQEDFLARWRNYQAHVSQWRQQYPHLASVDLRYEHEVVLKMAGDPNSTLTQKPPALPAQPAPQAPPKHRVQHAVVHRPPTPKHKPQSRGRGARSARHAGRRAA